MLAYVHTYIYISIVHIYVYVHWLIKISGTEFIVGNILVRMFIIVV